MDMDYQVVTVGNIIKRFLIGLIIDVVLLVVVSCIKYKEYIITAFANNTWAWIDAIMPVVIMVFAIGYVIRSLFR